MGLVYVWADAVHLSSISGVDEKGALVSQRWQRSRGPSAGFSASAFIREKL